MHRCGSDPLLKVMEKSWNFIWRPLWEPCLCLIGVLFWSLLRRSAMWTPYPALPASTFPSGLLETFQPSRRCSPYALFSLCANSLLPRALLKTERWVCLRRTSGNQSSVMTMGPLWPRALVSEDPLSPGITQILVPHLSEGTDLITAAGQEFVWVWAEETKHT